MEHARKASSPEPSYPVHDEVVARANESTTQLLSAKSTTEPASNPLSAYTISQQKTTSPESIETVESMEMALKILNSAPVLPTLSGGLERYRNNVSDIQQAFDSAFKAKSVEERSKNWNKCAITAKVLLTVLDEKRGKADCLAARNALKQWVQSYILLAKTNQSDLIACLESSTKHTRDEFITWCMAVAQAASIGTPTIAQDASLEYLCYVRAFNAGYAEAHLFITRDHLLGELYRKTPSCQRFLPMEAQVQLKCFATRKELLLRPGGLDETHYEIIYELVNLIRSDSKDRESKRDMLANRWIACKEYEVQQLAPMLYLQEAYGNLDIQKAKMHLDTISYERCQDLKAFPSFNQVHQYWFAEIGIVDPFNLAGGTLRMEQLADDMFPAALYSLIEYGQSCHNLKLTIACSLLLFEDLYQSEVKKWLQKYSLDDCIGLLEYMTLKSGHIRQRCFQMTMGPSFNSPLAYKVYRLWKGLGVQELRDCMQLNLAAMEAIIINKGIIHKVNDVLTIAYTTQENKANEINSQLPLSNLCLPIGCVEKIRPSLQNLENKFPFVYDTQMLVFRHFSDFLTQGKADKKLLDDAMAQNSVVTCYRLLSLNHCTEIWGYNKLIALLLRHEKESIELLSLWHRDAGLDNFIKQMTEAHTLKYPAAYCQLMHYLSKGINDKKTLIAIYMKVTTLQLVQGHVSDAKSTHKKARNVMPSDWNISPEGLENWHRILRSNMPKYYLDIYELGFDLSNSCNLSHDFYTLMRIGEYLLKNNNDPSAYLSWCYRVSPVFLVRYFTRSCNHKDASQLIAAYELLKKITSKISSLNQGVMIYTANRVEHFLENLPEDVSQTTVGKQLNETIAEIRNTSNAAIPHQFASCQESSAKCQGRNQNLSTAEPDNDLSECTLVTDNVYPQSVLSYDFYKDFMNSITEHILAPKIRKASSLQGAMALFNQLSEADDFSSARFTVLLIDTISRLETELVPGILERLFFCLDRLKRDCERSVKCFIQHVLRFTVLFFLNNMRVYLSKNAIEDLSVELEALKTSIWVAYPENYSFSELHSSICKEDESETIFKGCKLVGSINSLQALLRETKLHTTDDVLLIMRYIRSINKRESFEERFKPDNAHKKSEIAKLMHDILKGNTDNYKLASRVEISKHHYNKATLIWLALESGKFDDDTLNKIVDTKLEKTAAGYHFLKCLLESKPATISDHAIKFLKTINPGAGASATYKMRESHAIGIVNKLFGINKTSIIPLLGMSDAPNFSYLEAMLQWRHPGKVLSVMVTMDKIKTALVASGREAIPEASCRLLDFILEQESRGKTVSDITVYQCCRFLHARTFNATDEQALYQGITLYLGKGCLRDREEGLLRISQALASESPIPALRMARLQEQQLFPANVIKQDCLKLFAQKADTDQKPYRDYKQVIFIELLLSLGESGLDWLIGRLKSVPDGDISASRIAELLQEKLDIWRGNGMESSQKSSLPQKKNVAATVISKQLSQSVVKPKPQPIGGKRTQKRKEQEARRRRDFFQTRPHFVIGQEQPVSTQQLLEQLMVKNKDKAASEIPDEEITELLKLLEQLKRKTTTAIRDLSKNRLANLVRMLPWSATILGEVIAAHLKNMTDPHARANYARQQLERYECLVSEQLTVTGDTENQPQGAMAKAQAVTGKLLMQQSVPPGVQELIKNTAQVHQEALLSGNLSKDELSSAVWRYPDLYLHYLQEAKKPEINCVKNIWKGLDTSSQTALLIKTGAILITDQCGTDQDFAIKTLNAEKLNNDARLSLFESLSEKPKEALLMPGKGIPDNLVRAYLERMKKTQPKQKTTQHQIKNINQWQTSSEKRLTDNLIHLLKELPSNATESDKMKFREFRKALKKDMDLKIEAIKVMGASLTTGLAKRFKASAILMELKEIAKTEAEQETLQPG